MPNFKAKTPLGLMKLLEMGEMDILDALAAAPGIIAAKTAQEETERYEQRRRAWLEAYEPDLALCGEDEI